MSTGDDIPAEAEPVPAAAGDLRRDVAYKPDGRRITYYRRGTANPDPDTSRSAHHDD